MAKEIEAAVKPHLPMTLIITPTEIKKKKPTQNTVKPSSTYKSNF